MVDGKGEGSRVVGLPLGSTEKLGLIDGVLDTVGDVLGNDEMDGRTEGEAVGAKPQPSSDEHLRHASVSRSKTFLPLGFEDLKPLKHSQRGTKALSKSPTAVAWRSMHEV